MGGLFFALIVILLIWRMKPAAGVGSISTNELKDRLADRHVQFIDVRTPGEYKAGHIKQFRNIPLNSLQQQLGDLDKGKETIVICQSGSRSSQAAGRLKKAGFEKVINVRGGMGAWRG